ncbi:hypothetical protein T261_2336 [Streptomyces lydicus]|nr:hypothetical protein T261_2336 [Streptomyces lydicus]
MPGYLPSPRPRMPVTCVSALIVPRTVCDAAELLWPRWAMVKHWASTKRKPG